MPPQPSARAFCQRLQLIAFALIIAQLLYLIVGWTVSRGGSRGIVDAPEQRGLLIQIGFVIGIVLIAASFFAVRRPATGLAEHTARFFVGFAVAEVGALIGLGLCFALGAFTPLLVLAIATAATIFAHYTSITRRILASRELNPLG